MSDLEDYSVGSDVDSDNDSDILYQKNKNSKLKQNKPTIHDYEENDSDNDGEEENNENEEMEEDEDNEDENAYVENSEADDILDGEDDDEDDDEVDDDDEDIDEFMDNEDETTTIAKNNKSKQSGGANTTKMTKTKNIKANKTKQPTISLENPANEDDYDEDYEDEQDENYLQKFDKEITKNYIMEFHPECLNHNYDEVKALSKVTRDEHNIIIDPLHKTLPFLTKYEQARILGQRAKQIECGAKPLVKVPENIIDSYIIAKLELEQKKIPFIIRRPIPNGGCEYWSLQDLEIISF